MRYPEDLQLPEVCNQNWKVIHDYTVFLHVYQNIASLNHLHLDAMKVYNVDMPQRQSI